MSDHCLQDMRYRCCGMQELAAGGCTDLCDKCGERWGTAPPGCVMIRCGASLQC